MKAGGTRRVVVEIQFPVYAGRRCFWENNCQPMRWRTKRKVWGYLPDCFTAAPPVENADCMKDRSFVRLPSHFQESPRHSSGKRGERYRKGVYTCPWTNPNKGKRTLTNVHAKKIENHANKVLIHWCVTLSYSFLLKIKSNDESYGEKEKIIIAKIFNLLLYKLITV